jgi:putative transposase
VRLGRVPQPSAGIIDSQSVKTTSVGGVRGYDGGKQVKGCKRHLLVDTEGLVLTVSVHPANIMDRDGVKLLLPAEPMRADLPRLHHVWLDAGYNGQGKGKDWIEHTPDWSAEIVAHPPRYKKVWAPNDLPPDQINWSSTARCRRRAWCTRRCSATRAPAWCAMPRRCCAGQVLGTRSACGCRAIVTGSATAAHLGSHRRLGTRHPSHAMPRHATPCHATPYITSGHA